MRIYKNKRATILWTAAIVGIPLVIALLWLSFVVGVRGALLLVRFYLPVAGLVLLLIFLHHFPPRWVKGITAVLLCLFVLGVLLAVPSCLPMGDGSPRYARKWSARLAEVSSSQQARERYDQAGVREFTNGDWLVWVSDNSHGNPWGGTVVTRDNRGVVRAFYGHVCGRAFVHGDTLEDAYRYLDDFYGTSPADYRLKHSHR